MCSASLVQYSLRFPFFANLLSSGSFTGCTSRSVFQALSEPLDASKQIARSELEQFRPRDGIYVASGLVIIALSYLVHILAECIEHFSHTM